MAVQSAGHLLEATRADACMCNLEQGIGEDVWPLHIGIFSLYIH